MVLINPDCQRSEREGERHVSTVFIKYYFSTVLIKYYSSTMVLGWYCVDKVLF